MVDKKEVLDFIRNRQKSSEMELKIDGINMWVLMGAIAVVVWQFISNFDIKIIDNYDITVRAVVLVVDIYLFFALSFSSQMARDDARYFNRNFDTESSILIAIQGFIVALPSFISAFLKLGSIGAFLSLLFGFAVMSMGGKSLVGKLIDDAKNKRFPEPKFRMSKNGDAAGTLVLILFFALAIAEQIFYFVDNRTSFSISFAKNLILVCAAYWLVLVMVDRKQKNHDALWNYDIENELMIGSITPEIALKRIEYRTFGLSLQHVMDRFFGELNEKVSRLVVSLDECRDQLKAIDDVPVEYSAERAARIKSASEKPRKIIAELIADSEEFARYVVKLKKNKELCLYRPGVQDLIDGMLKKNIEVRNRAEKERLDFDRLLDQYKLGYGVSEKDRSEVEAVGKV